jgi:hypothetical protein
VQLEKHEAWVVYDKKGSEINQNDFRKEKLQSEMDEIDYQQSILKNERSDAANIIFDLKHEEKAEEEVKAMQPTFKRQSRML